MDWLQPFHFEIEFQRNAVTICGAQRAALMRTLDPRSRATFGLKEGFCFVEFRLVIDLEAEHIGLRFFTLFQDDAVMATFFHCAKVDFAVVLMCDLQAERIHIESSTCCQVRNHELHMAKAQHIKRRVKIMLW